MVLIRKFAVIKFEYFFYDNRDIKNDTQYLSNNISISLKIVKFCKINCNYSNLLNTSHNWFSFLLNKLCTFLSASRTGFFFKFKYFILRLWYIIKRFYKGKIIFKKYILIIDIEKSIFFLTNILKTRFSYTFEHLTIVTFIFFLTNQLYSQIYNTIIR